MIRRRPCRARQYAFLPQRLDVLPHRRRRSHPDLPGNHFHARVLAGVHSETLDKFKYLILASGRRLWRIAYHAAHYKQKRRRVSGYACGPRSLNRRSVRPGVPVVRAVRWREALSADGIAQAQALRERPRRGAITASGIIGGVMSASYKPNKCSTLSRSLLKADDL